MAWDLKDYEPVADRIARFWNDYPGGVITTDLVHHDNGHYIVKASIWRESIQVVGEYTSNPNPHATGYAEESVSQRGVNATSALENCETSAIGRALANLGYAPKGQRPSREEMDKVAAADPVEKNRRHNNALKNSLLDWVMGDRRKAHALWKDALSNIGLGPDELIPDDQLSVVEDGLRQAVADAQSLVVEKPDPLERPFD